MNTLTKKLVLSVLTLVLTVGAFAATTFAWFTLGNTAQIANFEADVVAGDGLEIQVVDGTTEGWYNTITPVELAGAIGTSTRLTALQTSDLTSFTKYGGSVAGVKNTDYIEFTLNFRTSKSSSNKVVSWNQASLSGAIGAFLADIPFTGTAGAVDIDDAYAISAAYGARVSVIGDQTVVYELPNGEKIGAAVIENVAGYTDLATTGAHNYWTLKNGGAALFSMTQTYTTNVALNTTKAPVVTLLDGADYAVGSVTVRVWLDGWDVDTFNAIFDLKLIVSLGFTLEA